MPKHGGIKNSLVWRMTQLTSVAGGQYAWKPNGEQKETRGRKIWLKYPHLALFCALVLFSGSALNTFSGTFTSVKTIIFLEM